MAAPKSDRSASERYEDKRAKAARASAEASRAGREIGPLPEPVDPKRRARCARNLKLFCSTYLKETFALKWSSVHLSAIGKLQGCGLKGGRFAFAMPRGGGKTVLCEATALWALLYGHRSFVVLIGSTEGAAVEMLGNIKTALESHELLGEDFPEACVPIRALGGSSHKAGGQMVDGELTKIQWTDKAIDLPSIKGSPSSGAFLRVAGLEGRIRGLSKTTAEGKRLRPDLAIIDDPQTDESATSPAQNAKRERYILGAVLGMAAPRKKIAAVMPCTVIAPGDLAERFLDHDRSPQWQGERSQLMPSFPDDKALWERYAHLRKEGMEEGGDRAAATAFYRANREAMDAGAVVTWPERYDPGQLSAVEYAMCLWIDDPRAFAAEYQNDPLAEDLLTGIVELTPDEVASRLCGLPRGSTPQHATRLVASIDVHGQNKCLYWMVCAWGEDYSGAVVDYGTWPRQNRAYFAASDARPDLAEMFPGFAETARIYKALESLMGELTGRTFPRPEGGHALPLERVLIDANWGFSTDTVYQFCRQSPHRALLMPSHGRGVTASNVPFRELPLKEGQRRGRDWRINPPATGRGRHVTFDSNSWKSFVVERIRVKEGEKGCLFLPGDRPGEHQLLADHLCSEYRVPTEGRGRKLEEWKRRPQNMDNHWLDTLVLCAVAASVQGLVWSTASAAGAPPPDVAPRKRQTLAEMYAAAKGKR